MAFFRNVVSFLFEKGSEEVIAKATALDPAKRLWLGYLRDDLPREAIKEQILNYFISLKYAASSDGPSLITASQPTSNKVIELKIGTTTKKERVLTAHDLSPDFDLQAFGDIMHHLAEQLVELKFFKAQEGEPLSFSSQLTLPPLSPSKPPLEPYASPRVVMALPGDLPGKAFLNYFVQVGLDQDWDPEEGKNTVTLTKGADKQKNVHGKITRSKIGDTALRCTYTVCAETGPMLWDELVIFLAEKNWLKSQALDTTPAKPPQPQFEPNNQADTQNHSQPHPGHPNGTEAHYHPEQDLHYPEPSQDYPPYNNGQDPIPPYDDQNPYAPYDGQDPYAPPHDGQDPYAPPHDGQDPYTPYGDQGSYDEQGSQYGEQDLQYGEQDLQYGEQDLQYGEQDPQYSEQDPQYSEDPYAPSHEGYGPPYDDENSYAPPYGEQDPHYVEPPLGPYVPHDSHNAEEYSEHSPHNGQEYSESSQAPYPEHEQDPYAPYDNQGVEDFEHADYIPQYDPQNPINGGQYYETPQYTEQGEQPQDFYPPPPYDGQQPDNTYEVGFHQDSTYNSQNTPPNNQLPADSQYHDPNHYDAYEAPLPPADGDYPQYEGSPQPIYDQQQTSALPHQLPPYNPIYDNPFHSHLGHPSAIPSQGLQDSGDNQQPPQHPHYELSHSSPAQEMESTEYPPPDPLESNNYDPLEQLDQDPTLEYQIHEQYQQGHQDALLEDSQPSEPCPPAEQLNGHPPGQPIEQLTEPSGQPIEQLTEPVEQLTESVEQLTERPPGQPIGQLTEPVEQLTEQPPGQPIEQLTEPVEQLTEQPTEQPSEQPFEQLSEQPVEQPVEQPGEQPEPIEEDITQERNEVLPIPQLEQDTEVLDENTENQEIQAIEMQPDDEAGREEIMDQTQLGVEQTQLPEPEDSNAANDLASSQEAKELPPPAQDQATTENLAFTEPKQEEISAPSEDLGEYIDFTPSQPKTPQLEDGEETRGDRPLLQDSSSDQEFVPQELQEPPQEFTAPQPDDPSSQELEHQEQPPQEPLSEPILEEPDAQEQPHQEEFTSQEPVLPQISITQEPLPELLHQEETPQEPTPQILQEQALIPQAEPELPFSQELPKHSEPELPISQEPPKYSEPSLPEPTPFSQGDIQQPAPPQHNQEPPRFAPSPSATQTPFAPPATPNQNHEPLSNEELKQRAFARAQARMAQRGGHLSPRQTTTPQRGSPHLPGQPIHPDSLPVENRPPQRRGTPPGHQQAHRDPRPDPNRPPLAQTSTQAQRPVDPRPPPPIDPRPPTNPRPPVDPNRPSVPPSPDNRPPRDPRHVDPRANQDNRPPPRSYPPNQRTPNPSPARQNPSTPPTAPRPGQGPALQGGHQLPPQHPQHVRPSQAIHPQTPNSPQPHFQKGPPQDERAPQQLAQGGSPRAPLDRQFQQHPTPNPQPAQLPPGTQPIPYPPQDRQPPQAHPQQHQPPQRPQQGAQRQNPQRPQHPQQPPHRQAPPQPPRHTERQPPLAHPTPYPQTHPHHPMGSNRPDRQPHPTQQATPQLQLTLPQQTLPQPPTSTPTHPQEPAPAQVYQDRLAPSNSQGPEEFSNEEIKARAFARAQARGQHPRPQPSLHLEQSNQPYPQSPTTPLQPQSTHLQPTYPQPPHSTHPQPTYPQPPQSTYPPSTYPQAQHAPAQPQHAPVHPQHAQYAPAQPQHALTQPQHVPTQPQHAPTQPQHVPTQPQQMPAQSLHTPTQPLHTPTQPPHTPTQPLPAQPPHTSAQPLHIPAGSYPKGQPGSTPTHPQHIPTQPTYPPQPTAHPHSLQSTPQSAPYTQPIPIQPAFPQTTPTYPNPQSASPHPAPIQPSYSPGQSQPFQHQEPSYPVHSGSTFPDVVTQGHGSQSALGANGHETLSNEEIKARALARAQARAQARRGGSAPGPISVPLGPALVSSTPVPLGFTPPKPIPAQTSSALTSPPPSAPVQGNPLANAEVEEAPSTWSKLTSFLGADEIAPDNDELPLHLKGRQKQAKPANSGLVTAQEEQMMGNPFATIWR